MNKSDILYAAYGSNLNVEQMAWRCPGARVIGSAELRDYHLLFRGSAGNSVATVERKVGSSVPVLLWHITPRDEKALDRYEGWPRFYRKETVTVYRECEPVETMVYIMNAGYPLGTPSEYYLNIIIQGYETAGFDHNALLAGLSALTADLMSSHTENPSNRRL